MGSMGVYIYIYRYGFGFRVLLRYIGELQRLCSDIWGYIEFTNVIMENHMEIAWK